MKKQYVAPQVEKIEFNYAETVVASYSEYTRVYAQNTVPASSCKIYQYSMVGDRVESEGCIKKIEPEFLPQ